MQTRNTLASDDARHAIEDAAWAPSVHNTRPWRFAVSGTRISLHADADRRSDVVDPAGRELLISCGAALYNLRLSLRMRGYGFLLRLLPVPGRPSLLAEIDVAPGAGPAGEELVREHAQIRRRRSHRGGFGPGEVPDEVFAALPYEDASLVRFGDVHEQDALAALSNAADRGTGPADDGTASAGAAVLLVTRDDTPAARLCAGQALQRLLLRAAEHGAAAAFHTQALQVPELRTVLRLQFCGGAHPQMMLRLGVAGGAEPRSVRRPVEDVISAE
ncbi:hypothetical protein BJF79_07985 [Actinomadura sp. CNU-125]|uniref:hypothetical protein n=1 Tax=Actinomadura sp. CNU-125 TaxID=1904961 RepID=UPI000962BC2C|nr:hypothetical protein [Actinomadura sp. CNU-125]OLT33211.1 hypothetical protein BJF79_07985 [Actinomadura sp. CNU-125]